MVARVDGIHHVTSGAGAAQQDIDFHTRVVGQRMIKQTVLFDGTAPIYHFYYANKKAEVGSVSTTFPFKQAGLVGRRGTGQISNIGYSVPVGSLSFWVDRLKRHKVKQGQVTERFGQKTLAFSHPTGFGLELIEDDKDKTEGWTTPEISADVAIRGFYSVVMAVRETEEQHRFFTDGLGFTKAGMDGAYTRYHINEGGAQKTVELLHQPDVPQGSWIFAQGMIHHVAFRVPTDKEQKVAKDYLEGIGYTDVSDVKDRNYFHSVYCRSPGGILCEIATSDIGFAIDEPMDKLGHKMLLPPWFEDRREEIVGPLEPIKVPEYLTT